MSRYEHPGTAWDSVRPDQETDQALDYHVRRMRDAIAGPLARAASVLDQAERHARDTTERGRLHGEDISMNFTLRQAKLYYHLLKGEELYRGWKSQHDQAAGLGALTELALARCTWELQRKFVAASGMKANPLIPSPRPLEQRASELAQAITRDPRSVVGVNIAGFSFDSLEEHLMDGVTGYILAGPTGSRAVVWTDEAASHSALGRMAGGLVWSDELGQPILPGVLDLYSSPAVVDAQGMPAEKLFAALLESQSRPCDSVPEKRR